jgi:hypothetical protein
MLEVVEVNIWSYLLAARQLNQLRDPTRSSQVHTTCISHAKRNYATEDDGEPVSHNSSSKRARTADSDQEEEHLPTTQRRRKPERNAKGKGRARANDSDDDQDDVDQEEEGEDDDEDEDDEEEIKPQAPEMDEELLDAQYGAAIRAQLENKKKVQGVSISGAYMISLFYTLGRVSLSTASSNTSK